MQEIKYARFLRRTQAVLIDAVIIPIALLFVIVLASEQGIKGELIAVMAVAIFFIFEPLLVSVLGATLGQKIVGIEVRNRKTGNKLNIFSATLRFISKIILGWASLVTIFSTYFHQAIHDLLVGSVVTLKNPELKPSYESQNSRVFEQPGYEYPSSLRKLLSAIIYNVISFTLFLFILSSNLFLSQNCLLYNSCSVEESVLVLIANVIWLIGIPYIIIMCRKGRLFGCRRKLTKI